MKPQKESKTPEAHETAFVSSHRMSAEELAEHKEWLRKHPHVVIKPTRKDWANEFRNYADRIIEDAERFAFRQNDPARAERYDFWRELVQRKRVSARKQFPNSPALPEMPSLTGNDFYALADYCTMAADVLDGRKAPDGDGGGAEKGEAEDLQPTSCLISLQVIGSGQVHDGWEALREILASATRKVDIEDAHINADVVALLRSAPDGVAVRVLTRKLYEDADPAFRRLAEQRSGTLEVRTTGNLHGRRIYVDEKAYILEDSIKDLASKTASSIVPVHEQTEARRLMEDFERRWATAGVNIRPKA